MVSKKSKGVGPLGGASPYKNLLSTPPPPGYGQTKAKQKTVKTVIWIGPLLCS